MDVKKERERLALLLAQEGWQPKTGQACRDPESTSMADWRWRLADCCWLSSTGRPPAGPALSASLERAKKAGPDLSDDVTVDSLLLGRDFQVQLDEEGDFEDPRGPDGPVWVVTVQCSYSGVTSFHHDRACAIATAHLGELRRAKEIA